MKTISPFHGRSRARSLSAVAFSAIAALSLAACSSGSSSSSSSSAKADYGDINIQLSYLKNTEFAGEYMAEENGYFSKAGFGDVTLTAGGGSASAEAQVTTGKALVGISSPLITSPAIKKGAALKVIAADYQKNPFDIVSLDSAKLSTPADLKGKTIAVADFNSLVWQAFLAANGLQKSDVKTVPYTDGTSQLASGQVDGYLGYTTAFTGTIGAKKLAAHEFLLADEGLPLVSETVFASQDSIDNDRDELEALLTAMVKGWDDAVADQEAATKITVEKYGKDQDYDYASQLASMQKQTSDLMTTDDTDQNGLLTVTPELQKQTVASLKLAGINITTSQLFDMSLLNDVYAKNPGLIK